MFFAAGPIGQANSLKAMGVTPAEQQRMVRVRRPQTGHGCADRQKFEKDAFVCGSRFTMADVVGSHGWGIAFGIMPKREARCSPTRRGCANGLGLPVGQGDRQCLDRPTGPATVR